MIHPKSGFLTQHSTQHNERETVQLAPRMCLVIMTGRPRASTAMTSKVVLGNIDRRYETRWRWECFTQAVDIAVTAIVA